ncbi:MAG: hypothetical protein AAGE61_12025 [Pseudomonadota bacterium]
MISYSVRPLAHAGLVLFLTLLTQIGGLAWLAALFFRWRILAFLVIYTALTFATLFIAPVFVREAITCQSGTHLKMQSWMYCALNRQYVTPELHEAAQDLALALDKDNPGTQTLALDGSFPFINGFPLLPHLSHDDGKKLDLAFFYRDSSGYKPGVTRSPIGYFAFEDGPTHCPTRLLSLRWDFAWLQPLWRDLPLDDTRMLATIQWLATDPLIGKVFLEPHLLERYGIQSEKFRFQGCRAARHDDHFHIQL